MESIKSINTDGKGFFEAFDSFDAKTALFTMIDFGSGFVRPWIFLYLELMMIKVIKLKDGLDVEVEVDDSHAHEISYDGVVDSSIDKIQSLLKKVIQPISNTYKEISRDSSIESTKVTIGVNISVEGNFVLAKSSAGANIQVEMTLRPTNG